MTVKIACVAFDCLDALVVGRFWSAAIGRPLDPGASSEFASIGFHGRRDRAGWAPVERDADPTWLFARVPESKTVKNRLHLDVIAADPAPATWPGRRSVAKRVPLVQRGQHFLDVAVYRDVRE